MSIKPFKTSRSLMENAENMEIGDRVKAKDLYGGKIGTISDFGRDKAFTVVKHDDGTSSSYHSSDLLPHHDDEESVHESGCGDKEGKKHKEVQEDCWKGYKQLGMKKKNGKTVPNCVPVSEAAYDSKLDPQKKIVVQGVKGMKSKPFTKKFRNMDHFNKWTDSEQFGDHQIHRVMNEQEQILSFKQFCEAIDNGQIVIGKGTEVQGNTYGEPYEPETTKNENGK